MQVVLPDGAVVLARGRLDLVPGERSREPDFAVYHPSAVETPDQEQMVARFASTLRE